MIQDWPHVHNIVRDLNDPIFSAAFGDLKLVFRDQVVIPYFKGLLSLVSQEWNELLQLYPETELVLLPEFSLAEFFGELLEDQDAGKNKFDESQAGQADLEDIFLYNEDFTQIKMEEKEEDHASSSVDFNTDETDVNTTSKDVASSLEKAQTFREFVTLSRDREEDATPGPVVDLKGLTGSFYLPGIEEDFQWPPRFRD